MLTLSISLIWHVVFVVPVAFSLFVFLLKVNISLLFYQESKDIVIIYDGLRRSAITLNVLNKNVPRNIEKNTKVSTKITNL